LFPPTGFILSFGLKDLIFQLISRFLMNALVTEYFSEIPFKLAILSNIATLRIFTNRLTDIVIDF
jgi:hypothetical protein